ncbi:tryptophan-rich sensory protein [Candidatus Uhrbacteria bacterium]|nr:tryptophan-rich sensory protein [Candidatus Uhrbacteria bacterium]
MKRQDIIACFFSIAVCLIAAAIGSIFTSASLPIWYSSLTKPALNPPSWVFGPVWTVLYILMGIAAFLIWQKGWKRKDVQEALSVFGLQLGLNILWSMFFFGLQNPGLAFLDIVLLWLSIIWTIVLFQKLSRPAAYLLAPYLAWVTFASYLNLSIWLLN